MYPQPGQLVQVRARAWLVERVERPAHPLARCAFVDLVGADSDNAERRLSVIWDAELDARILDEGDFAALGGRDFDPRPLFAAYLRAARWSAVTAADPRLLQAPFRAGIRLDAYQLEPLAKALRLPRVNLLIADDVGLGKTIEAGLVVRELMLRRRVDLMVVAAPPSMLHQWRAELESRFGLDPVLLDRGFLRSLRRRRGFGADPWTAHSRFLISHQLLIDDYWRDGLARLLGDFRPKSLLILDEAHHAAPASGERLAIDSQLTRTIRDLAPRFEHRLFLTATPHNGHSNSFAALLEMLDPQRFVRGLKVRKRDLEPIAVRRLKEDLRASGDPGRGFPERRVEAIEVTLPADDPELRLGRLLDAYRRAVEERVSRLPRGRRRAALLVLATLQHRLLSSIAAFHATLDRHRRAVERAAQRARAGRGEAARASMPALARLLEPIGPDEATDLVEPEGTETADGEIELEEAGLQAAEVLTEQAFDGQMPSVRERELLEQMAAIAREAAHRRDRRIAWLLDWIDREACPGFRRDPEGARWTDARLVVFTEWEETRRWLERHLRAAVEPTDRGQERIACFTGLTSPETRRRIQRAFNEPPDRNPIRILLCTDAAREGLNLQRHCHELLHFDLPWNPARIEQRNGRIDRKLQPAPIVWCRYFFFPQRPEDRVLRALLRKTETIRRELGPMGRVLDERLHGRLESGIPHEEADQLAREIEQTELFGRETIREELEEERDAPARARLADRLDQLRRQLEESREKLRFEPDRLRRVVDASLRLLYRARGLEPAGEAKAADGSPIPLWRLDPEDPALRSDRELARLIEETLGWPADLPGEPRSGARPVTFVETDQLGEDAVQLHLEHPLVRRLLARFGAQGVIDHLLSRACLSTTRIAQPRALLLGRLLLYGPGGVRLHEEILAVAAPWIPPERRSGPLRVLTEETTEKLLDELEASLDEEEDSGAPPPEAVQARLREAIARDVVELRPALEERAARAAETARRSLADRAQEESASLERVLAELEERLRCELQRPQLALDLSEVERRQAAAERRAQEERLARLSQDREREPQRVREQYEVKARRLEPLGLVYLWPAGPARRSP